MQKGLKLITLKGAIEKSPILLSQYWKNEWLDGSIIILYFGGSSNIFADCICIYSIYTLTNCSKYLPGLRTGTFENDILLFDPKIQS